MHIEDVFGDLPTLETERLRLRKLKRADAQDVFAYASDAFVAATTTWAPHDSLEQSRQFIERVLRFYRSGDVAPWGVELKAEQRIIGTCGFGSWDLRHHRAEVGYALARPYWGQGYTTEAVRSVVAFGFRHMQLTRIQAMCLPENIASARVMEKAGMQYEGLLRQYIYIKGAACDLKMYAILREEFEPRATP